MRLGFRSYIHVGAEPPAARQYPKFYIELGFKRDTFGAFAQSQGVHGLFSEYFGPRYFDKLQERYKQALSAEATRILERLQSQLAEQLSSSDYEKLIDNVMHRIWAPPVWPPSQLILDVFNEIAIRFIGNGTPVRFYRYVIDSNLQRNDGEAQTREFLARLGRAVSGDRPKEMFDKKDCAIMVFSANKMLCGVPPLPSWRDEAALGCVKLASGDHRFTMDAYRDRLRKLGLSSQKPKLIRGSLTNGALAIEWARPIRNLVKSRTEKN